MADPWKALANDDGRAPAGAAAGPRRLEPFTAPPDPKEPGPDDRAEPAPLSGPPAATPGLAGHQALAALAVELAEAAAGDGGAAEPEAGRDEDRKPSSHGQGTISLVGNPGPADQPALSPGGPVATTSRVVPAASDRPAGFPMARPLSRLPLPAASGGTPGPTAGIDRNGLADGGAGPLSLSQPPPLGVVRLNTDRTSSSTASTPAEQATIPLRKRAISDLPASVAPAPSDPVAAGPVPGLAPATVAGRDVPSVEAWTAAEDDILPRRPVRRTRPWGRRR